MVNSFFVKHKQYYLGYDKFSDEQVFGSESGDVIWRIRFQFTSYTKALPYIFELQTSSSPPKPSGSVAKYLEGFNIEVSFQEFFESDIVPDDIKKTLIWYIPNPNVTE